MTKDVIIVEKSTVPVKTCDYIEAILKTNSKINQARFSVISNPEFMAEGSAI